MKLLELKQQAGIQDNPDQEGLDLFALMIIQECIDIADGVYTMHVPAGPIIKQRFGVE